MFCRKSDMEEEAIKQTLSSLPVSAVSYLLNIGVCPRCVFRIFGVQGDVYLSDMLSFKCVQSLIKSFDDGNGHIIIEVNDSSHTEGQEGREKTCIICLGILQMVCYSENESTTSSNNGISEIADCIANKVKDEGHHFNSFWFEISIPSVVLVREHAIRLHIRKKYGTELWFKHVENHSSVKDVLKFTLTKPLESLLGYKSDNHSSFRIVLIFNHEETSAELGFLKNSKEVNAKRKRKGYTINLESCNLSMVEAARIAANGESFSAIQQTLGSISNEDFLKKYDCPPKKILSTSKLTCMCYQIPTYIGGRYLKLSRNVSQTCWKIDDERRGIASVEEIIGSAVLPYLKGDRYKFHAAGREDIDVRMLGSGRPFLVEVQNARLLAKDLDWVKLQNEINNLEDGFKKVKVKELKHVGVEAWDQMREGEAEKQKEYAAVVWISHAISEDDLKSLSEIKKLEIDQKTPVRVLHRRSPLVRKRSIFWMKAEKIEGSDHYFLLYLCTQAGTYIKEFVHGDFGRTHPSIGSLLGCTAEILQLDVTDVRMDYCL